MDSSITWKYEPDTPKDKPRCMMGYVNVENKSVRILHHRDELQEFIDFMSNFEIKSWLEIGVYDGGGIYIWKDIVSNDGIIVGIDNRCHPVNLKNIVKPTQQVHFINGNINESNKDKIISYSNNYDVVFIDSDHTYDAVSRDYKLFSKLANKFIIIHDIYRYHEGAGKFFDEIKNNYNKHISISEQNPVIGYGILYED